MIHTREIRWFLPAVLLELSDWFAGQGAVLAEAPVRTDEYFLTGDTSLGIKLREGRVEVKKRLTEPGRLVLVNGSTGNLDGWVKYSFDIAAGDRESAGVLSGNAKGHWIRVQKKRTGFKEWRNARGELTQVPIAELVPAGLQFELSELLIDRRRYYSFCVEEFGEGNLAIEQSQAIRQLPALPELDQKNSMSYPEFLVRT